MNEPHLRPSSDLPGARPPLRVDIERGDVVESSHRVHVSVVREQGPPMAAGDPALRTYFRSSAKPFQALPLVEDGVAEAFGWGDAELALCCASHSGEPIHVAGVMAMLESIGLGPEDLECGPQAPFGQAAAQAFWAAGERPDAIHNNCSGKHAGMLALARHHGWPTRGYVRADHPVQVRMQEEIVRWTGLSADSIATAPDGCGVVCFALPLHAMAVAYARLARASRSGAPAAAIVRAMMEHPHAVAGTGRMCTRVMEAAPGAVLAKLGAEGVYGACLPAAGVGFALKAECGSFRAVEAALVHVLSWLEALDESTSERLLDNPIRNKRGEAVGRVVITGSLAPAGTAIGLPEPV